MTLQDLTILANKIMEYYFVIGFILTIIILNINVIFIIYRELKEKGII